MKTNFFRKIKIVQTQCIASLIQTRHATSLLSALLLCPMILSAQNGVTVSGLAVNSGTVTFNVNWKNTGMPAIWSDTVWVFVDYNDNGTMKRLPVSAGATSTATSAPGVGKVIEETGNNQGVWVVGNARSAGSFSATVKLLTATTNLAGVCAYASNYPPVGEYISDTEISFTGTPMYNIVLKNGSSATSTWYSTGQFTIPPGYTLQSFSDKTGAPGLMNCTAPGSTVNFTAFAPCSTAPTGATWTIRDARDAKQYKVVKMPDGRLWFAQNLDYRKDLYFNAFSNQANGAAFTSMSNGVPAIGSYWCPGVSGSTYSGDQNTCNIYGALYTWETAMMVDGKYADEAHLSTAWTEPAANYFSGAPSAAAADLNNARGGVNIKGGGRGICPNGWHVPTDYEWAYMLDKVDGSGTGSIYMHQSGTGGVGTDAGLKIKSAATYSGTDPGNGSWPARTPANDNSTGFSLLPAGYRYSHGGNYENRGAIGLLWQSSVSYSLWTYYREMPNTVGIIRENKTRSYGFSIRCIRN